MNNLDTRITDVELSVRSTNALHTLNIKTIRDLVAFSGEELLKTNRMMGKKSVYEIKMKLKEMELTLKDDPEQWTPFDGVWYDFRKIKPPEEERRYLITIKRNRSKKLNIKICRWGRKSSCKWNWHASSLPVSNIKHFMLLPRLPRDLNQEGKDE